MAEQAEDIDKANEALRESEERFRVTFEQAGVGIAHISPDGRWLRMNQKLCDIVGYSRDELLNLSFQDICVPEDKGRDVQLFDDLISGEISQYALEKRYLRKDGKVVWANKTTSVVRDDEGQAKYIISVLEDISERKRIENEIQQQSSQLAHISRLNVIEQLASGIAHEMNQPLTAISAYAQACRRGIASGKSKPDKLVESLEKIIAQTVRASDIINKVRAFSSKHVSEKHFYDLNAAIHETTALLMHPHTSQGTAIKLDLAKDLPQIKADRDQIEQLIINLVLNSIEALQDRNSSDKKLYIRTGPVDENDIKIEIEDNGPGISAEILDRVLEPFFTTKEGGMGLGLAISQSIAESHGGRLNVASEPGNGATVTIILPKDDGYDD